jgi:ketosteroid isomerase-like protein
MLAVVALAGVPAHAMADVYTCTDAEGRMVFRDTPCPGDERHGARRDAAIADPGAGTQRRGKRAAVGAPLDREQVERLVMRFDKAMSKRDAKAVTALLAEDAVVEVAGESGRRTEAMPPKAYARHLADAFARPGYRYEPRAPRISLSKSKPRATVTRVVREGALVGDSVVAVEMRERLTVQQDGRRLLIRKLHRKAGDGGTSE